MGGREMAKTKVSTTENQPVIEGKKPNKKTIPQSVLTRLHTKSGNKCAICKTILVDPNANNTTPVACVGENAHIYGEMPGSARYDQVLSPNLATQEQNLIFLCCNCHRTIDTEVVNYPPDKLLKIKKDHENWIIGKDTENSDFTFAELKTLTDDIQKLDNQYPDDPGNYTLLKIKNKLERNSLSDPNVQQSVKLGLSRVSMIEDYFNQCIEPNLSERVALFMKTEYTRLREQEMDPHDIFYSLWNKIAPNATDNKLRVAGLGLMVYFFEKCEIFET